MRPEWLISGLSDEEEKTDTNTETNRPTELVSTLLAYWASPTFVRRHASLTLVQLQQLQPGVDLDVLLEQPEGLGRRSLISAEAIQDTLAGTRVSAGLTDQTHWEEPALLLDCLLSCAKYTSVFFALFPSILFCFCPFVFAISCHH